MNREQKQAKRNQIVSQLISILQVYDYTYNECYFYEDVTMGMLDFSCDMVSRNLFSDMEKIGLKIYHIYYSKLESYRISFKFKYHD